MSIVPYFHDFEEPFRMMEQEFFRSELMSPFKWMRRGVFAPSLLKHWDQITRPSKQTGQLSEKDGTSDDDDTFQVRVDVQHFSPEEISVKVVNRQVIVEGKHEEKQDDHGFVSRRFVRRYALPQGCLPDTVQSQLSSDGVLTVSAPKVLPLPSIGERIIPITQTGPIKKQLSPSGPQIETEATVENKN